MVLERKHKDAKDIAKIIPTQDTSGTGAFEQAVMLRMLFHQKVGLENLTFTGTGQAQLVGQEADVTDVLAPTLQQHVVVMGPIFASKEGQAQQTKSETRETKQDNRYKTHK